MHGLYSLQTQAGVRIHELPRSACILRFKLLLCPEKRVHFCCLLQPTASRAKACRCQGPHCLGRASEAQEGHGRWREKAMTLSRSRGRSDTQGHVGARAGRSGLEVSFGGVLREFLRVCRSGTTNVLRVVVTSSYKAEAGRGGCPSARHGRCNFELSTKLKRGARIDRLQCDKSAKAAI